MSYNLRCPVSLLHQNPYKPDPAVSRNSQRMIGEILIPWHDHVIVLIIYTHFMEQFQPQCRLRYVRCQLLWWLWVHKFRLVRVPAEGRFHAQVMSWLWAQHPALRKLRYFPCTPDYEYLDKPVRNLMRLWLGGGIHCWHPVEQWQCSIAASASSNRSRTNGSKINFMLNDD